MENDKKTKFMVYNLLNSLEMTIWIFLTISWIYIFLRWDTVLWSIIIIAWLVFDMFYIIDHLYLMILENRSEITKLKKK